MIVDCRLKVAGQPFADTAAALEGGSPTALADLDLTWGRATTVDQPDAASCRVAVLDRAGGDTLLDALPIGATLEVWARGDIGTGAIANVMVDGGFEGRPLGPAGNRVHQSEPAAAATIVAAPVDAGTRALQFSRLASSSTATVDVPADAYVPGAPTAWDDVPALTAGAVWSWSARVRSSIGVPATVAFGAAAGPEVPADIIRDTATVPAPPSSSGEFHTVTGTYTVPAAADGRWPALCFSEAAILAWSQLAGSWAALPGSWADYGTVTVDTLELMAPATVVRDVLVFAGRITDLAVTVEPSLDTARAELIAVDQKAELVNRYVGDTPWPAETLATRVGKIVAATGLDVDVRIDVPLDTAVISKRDVDNQPAGGLLTELAAGVDGVLWSASHHTTGPFLWYENVGSRVSLGTLELIDGMVIITVDEPTSRPTGRTVLDGCELTAAGVTWRRDITDVLNRVDAMWVEQVTPPVEHTVTVTDAASEAAAGSRRIGVNTNLTSSAAASEVARRILLRTRIPQWRCDGLTVDAGRWPPAAGADTADLLDLLDGTTRLGRGLVITNIVGWPGGDTVGSYLDGGNYRFDGAWHLALATTPMGGFGESVAWNELDPSWQWRQLDPSIAWSDLYGVTGPLSP